MARSGLLDGKAVLVTGGGSGIGRAACLLFLQEGAKVLALDSRNDTLEATLGLARPLGDVYGMVADVSSRTDVDRAVDYCIERFGGIDAAFNNAGIDGRTPSFDRTATFPNDLWRLVIEVNQTGVYNCMQAEIAAMLPNRRGAIVNTSSVAGVRGGAPATAAYTASKAAVIGLSRLTALEYAADGIRVNVVAPGGVDTPMNAGVDMERVALKQPMQRVGTPLEIAEAAAWLLSDRASFVTAQVLCVDGGWSETLRSS